MTSKAELDELMREIDDLLKYHDVCYHYVISGSQEVAGCLALEIGSGSAFSRDGNDNFYIDTDYPPELVAEAIQTAHIMAVECAEIAVHLQRLADDAGGQTPTVTPISSANRKTTH